MTDPCQSFPKELLLDRENLYLEIPKKQNTLRTEFSGYMNFIIIVYSVNINSIYKV